MKRRRLSRFEAAAQRLIEGTFSRFLGGRVEASEIASRLGRALEDSYEAGEVGELFVVHLHPADLEQIERNAPEMRERMANYLVRLAQQTGMTLPNRPEVQFTAEGGLQPKQIKIETLYKDETDESTKQYRPDQLAEASQTYEAIRQLDAFLIIDGGRHVALRKPLVSIGRLEENDVLLDSMAVSRKHAQLRWRYGRFIIYDLGSRAGTLVNDQPVVEYVLHPGDVITLGDLVLIYGEGAADEHPRPQSSVLEGEDTVAQPSVRKEQEGSSHEHYQDDTLRG